MQTTTTDAVSDQDVKEMLRGLAATLRFAADGKLALSTELLREKADVLEWFASAQPDP